MIVILLVILCVPPSPIAVSFTIKEPLPEYMCFVSLSVEEVPSPNSHKNHVALVEELEKNTSLGAGLLSPVTLKLATGAGLGSSFLQFEKIRATVAKRSIRVIVLSITSL